MRAIAVWAVLAVIAAASLGTAAWMIYDANGRELAYKQFASNNAQADANRASIYKQTSCGPLAPQARAKCESEAYYSGHQAQHDDADLEAQRTTAVWTRYLGIAGVAGTAFGLLGVALVLLTFAEQRNTSRAELRAYVDVEPATVRINATTGEASADLKISNNGQTPAFETSWAGSMMIRTSEQAERDLAATKAANMAPEGRASPTTIHGGKDVLGTVGPDQNHYFTQEEMRDAIAGKKNVYVFGTVWYRDAFRSARFCNFCFQADNIGSPIKAGQPLKPRSGGGLTTPFHNDSN